MKRVVAKLRNSLLFVYRMGLVHFANEAWYRIVDGYYEQRLNVNTRHLVTKEVLGILNSESVYYVPMNYWPLLRVLRDAAAEPEKIVFLDYGSGKGRAIVVAATFPFKRVLGVELAESLVAVARNNVARMKHRRARQVEIEQADAASFRVPPDVNLIYFFNPFKGTLLERVVANIRASYEATPRKIGIIFFNNDFFEKAIAGQEWLFKTAQRRFLNYSCGIYETATPRRDPMATPGDAAVTP